jgi:FSR family fosmidomycin resistance protein-like MFS transporter
MVCVPTAAETRAARFSLISLVLLSLGHYSVDLYSGALGALQPLLVKRFAMSLTEAGVLGGMVVLSGSVMQPLYGYFSDRLGTNLFVAFGPVIAALVISSIGLAPGYGWALAAVAIGGAGVAAFHPQATSRAAAGVGGRRGRYMAIFVSAGTLGFACSPVYFSTLANWLGLDRMYWGAIPGVMVGLLLLYVLPPAARHARQKQAGGWDEMRARWKPLAILYALVFFRSVVQVTFAQLIPLYLTLERGYSLTRASLALSLFSASGALGGFVGGHLADWLGHRRIVIISMIVSAPFLTVFFLTEGFVSLASLAMGGTLLLFTLPVNVVMAQELVPSRAGTVSALMMGFAWGMAGLIFVPLTGWLGDRFSLHYALMGLVAFPVLGFFLSLRLPK